MICCMTASVSRFRFSIPVYSRRCTVGMQSFNKRGNAGVGGVLVPDEHVDRDRVHLVHHADDRVGGGRDERLAPELVT